MFGYLLTVTPIIQLKRNRRSKIWNINNREIIRGLTSSQQRKLRIICSCTNTHLFFSFKAAHNSFCNTLLHTYLLKVGARSIPVNAKLYMREMGYKNHTLGNKEEQSNQQRRTQSRHQPVNGECPHYQVILLRNVELEHVASAGI